jgi:putative phosphonate metabolism protein
MRYALYFAPAASHPLWRKGNVWLGRDAESGRAFVAPDVPGLGAEEVEALTAAPRHYGLHATIKAPFRLAEGRDETELLARIDEFCSRQKPFTLPSLAVQPLDDFIALQTPQPCPKLHALADACVAEFDEFRAPLRAAELARRRADALDANAAARLARWGYPHVFEGFRFHMTLTGNVSPEVQAMLLPWLTDHFAPALKTPCRCDGLALCVEPFAGAPFRLARRFAFAAKTMTCAAA